MDQRALRFLAMATCERACSIVATVPSSFWITNKTVRHRVQNVLLVLHVLYNF